MRCTTDCATLAWDSGPIIISEIKQIVNNYLPCVSRNIKKDRISEQAARHSPQNGVLRSPKRKTAAQQGTAAWSSCAGLGYIRKCRAGNGKRSWFWFGLFGLNQSRMPVDLVGDQHHGLLCNPVHQHQIDIPFRRRQLNLDMGNVRFVFASGKERRAKNFSS